jgi:hypothetical protein
MSRIAPQGLWTVGASRQKGQVISYVTMVYYSHPRNTRGFGWSCAGGRVRQPGPRPGLRVS